MTPPDDRPAAHDHADHLHSEHAQNPETGQANPPAPTHRHPHADHREHNRGAKTGGDGHDDTGGSFHGAHDHDGHDNHPHDRPVGFRGVVTSVFRPHSHDAADSLDTALEASRDGMRALKISLAGLAVTAAIQVTVFAFSGSVALLGDTVHNFADALTALPLGFAFWLGRRPATKRYTYGYGRSEDLAGITILAIIAASSTLAAWEAVNRIVHPRTVHRIGWVIAAGLVGFAGNELVAVYRIRVGRKIGSAALVADGLHARTDGLTSLAVVAGAIGVAAGWQPADPIVGLVITLVILIVLKNAARDIYRRLMDAVDPTLVDEITAVLAGSAGIEAVHSVRVRWVGHELHAEAEVVSDADLTIAQAHDFAEHAHHDLLHRIPRLAVANIHTSPCGHDGTDPHVLTAHHRAS